MSLPQRSINIRMPDELADAMDRLAQAIPRLGRAAILRALLAEALQGRSLEAQVGIVVAQLQRARPSRRASRAEGEP